MISKLIDTSLRPKTILLAIGFAVLLMWAGILPSAHADQHEGEEGEHELFLVDETGEDEFRECVIAAIGVFPEGDVEISQE